MKRVTRVGRTRGRKKDRWVPSGPARSQTTSGFWGTTAIFIVELLRYIESDGNTDF